LHIAALLSNRGLRHHISRAGFELVDARGARRVAAALLVGSITVRQAVAADAECLHRWRNDPAVRSAAHDPAEIAYADHERWLEGVLSSPSRYLLIGEREGALIGSVRFDIKDKAALVSIYLAPERIGRGEGSALLRAAETWLRREHPYVRTLNAEVRSENAVSQRLFERGGYRPQTIFFSKSL
jgi:RimJ/RimL family protein N-acetyltransferase